MVHSWARSADDPVAMFSLPPSFSAGSASHSSRPDGRARESVASKPRSRTPSRSGRELRDASSVPTSPAPAWTTGHVKADAWVSDKNLEQEVLANLASVPQAKRLQFVLSTIEKNVDNPAAWINACIRNWKNGNMAARLLDGANVHGADRSRSTNARHSPAIGLSTEPFVSSVAPSDPLQAVSVVQSGTQPAQDAIQMKTFWPSEKSNLITILAEMLEEDVALQFFELPPEDQCGICYAYMLTAAQGDTAAAKNSMIKAWIRRLSVLDGSTDRPPPRTLLPTVSSVKIHLQVVLAGMPSVMAGTMMSVLNQVVPTLHRDISIDFFPTIYVDVFEEDNANIASVADSFRQPFLTRVTTMQDFADELENLMMEWKKVNTKFLFLTNVGLASTPDEHVKDLDASRLHRKDTNWIWNFCQAADAVRQFMSNADVAEIFIGSQTPAFHQQLSNIWGEPTSAQAVKHPKVPVSMPQVFSTPSGFTVLAVVQNEHLNNDSIDRWGAPDLAAWMDKYHGAAISPSMVAKLMVMKLFKERPLRKEEEDMLKAVSMKNDSGVQTSLSRIHFLSLYGYAGTPAEELLNVQFPCMENIFPTTGLSAKNKSKITRPCGQERYCRQCEKLFTVIDRSYPTYVVCDVLLAIFTKVAPTWSGQQDIDSAMWARKDVNRIHSCGPTCPGHL